MKMNILFSTITLLLILPCFTFAADKTGPRRPLRMEVQTKFPFDPKAKGNAQLINESVLAADNFLRQNRRRFKIDEPSRNLIPKLGKMDQQIIVQNNKKTIITKIHVRYSVTCPDGYDIDGAELVAHLNDQKMVESVNGNTSACPVAPQTIEIGEDEAKGLARKFWQSQGGRDDDNALAERATLTYFVPSLFTTVSFNPEQREKDKLVRDQVKKEVEEEAKTVIAKELTDMGLTRKEIAEELDRYRLDRESYIDKKTHEDKVGLDDEDQIFIKNFSKHIWPQWEVGQTYLTYKVEVEGNETHQGGTYFIDATDGTWRNYIPAAQKLTRQIFDCQGGTSSSGCALSRSEGQGPVALEDVNLWYDDTLGVNNFLLSTVGRNGANGLGGLSSGNDTVVAYVNYGASYFAPVLGGSQYLPPTMTANTRIETTHEWTDPASFAHEIFHGVEYFTHAPGGMTYQFQTGALMESNSNIFAEAYRQTVPDRNIEEDWKIIFDSPAVDQGSYPQGFHVDMRYPQNDASIYGAYGDPDSLFSRDFYCGSVAVDNGGVHANSYPITKAAWLLTEGGTFNNCAIAPIGLDKVHQIWYYAMANYFTASEIFFSTDPLVSNAYTNLIKACKVLYPGPSPEVLSPECQNVTAALQAVEFNQVDSSGKPGRCSTTQQRAIPACATNSCVPHTADTTSVAPYVTYLTRTYRDRCLEGNLLIHHSCNGDTPSKLTYNYQVCPNGCGNGVCL
jgi:Zn-dependent metalloprotease